MHRGPMRPVEVPRDSQAHRGLACEAQERRPNRGRRRWWAWPPTWGHSRGRDRQRPDVLSALDDGTQVAYEVQFAALTADAWQARHDRYMSGGIKTSACSATRPITDSDAPTRTDATATHQRGRGQPGDCFERIANMMSPASW